MRSQQIVTVYSELSRVDLYFYNTPPQPRQRRVQVATPLWSVAAEVVL